MSEVTNHSIVILRILQASKTFVCVYKILHFCANLQKFQTSPTKNSHLKVYEALSVIPIGIVHSHLGASLLARICIVIVLDYTTCIQCRSSRHVQVYNIATYPQGILSILIQGTCFNSLYVATPLLT